MGSKKSESAATAITTETKAPALALVDPLADVLGGAELDVTGAEEMGAEDVRIPVYVFNTKFTPPGDDTPIPPNRFLQTVSEEVKPKLRLQVVTNHKSRAWSYFDEAEGKRRTPCKSQDNVTGRMSDGRTRLCANCPDYQWRKDEQTGKNTRNCSDVFNVISIDRESGDVVMLILRKTAIRPFREYYQKHFHRKRAVPGQFRKTDMPFFAYETLVTLRMERDGGMTWAVPVFEQGPLLERTDILGAAELAREFLERAAHVVEQSTVAAEQVEGDEGGDGSFDFGGNVVDAEPAQAAGGRF